MFSKGASNLKWNKADDDVDGDDDYDGDCGDSDDGVVVSGGGGDDDWWK